MPPPTAIRSISTESDGTVVIERRYGCYSWGLLISLFLLAFVAIISVVLLVESDDAVLLLSVLLGVLIAVGVIAILFLQWQRRRATSRRDRGATEWVRQTHSQDQLHATPSAPPPSTSGRSSWALWTPWKSSVVYHSDVSAPRVYVDPTPSAPRESKYQL